MSKVLMYTGAYAGPVFPSLPTLLELQSRGHDVVVAAALLRGAAPSCAPLGRWVAHLKPDLSTFGESRSQDSSEVGIDAAFAHWGEPTANELSYLLAQEWT